MYYSALRMVLPNVNAYVLILCVALYAIHVGSLLNKRWRPVFFVLAFAIVLRIVAVKFAWSTWLRGIDTAVFVKTILLDGILQVIGCIICVALGVFVIRRMRRRQPVVKDEGSIEPPSYPSANATRGSLTIAAIVLGLFLCLNVAPFLFKAKCASDSRRRPNVIYIMVDTLRADHLGCYGYQRSTSPNIDGLAEQSLRFSRAISQAPWTTASISSFMSSRYLRLVGDPGHVFTPPINILLMPELLQDQGYTTGAVISNPLAGREYGLDRGYDRYYETSGADIKSFAWKSSMPSTVVQKSLEMINEMKNQRFFMFVHFIGPHSPYVAHPEYNFYPDYKGKLGRDGFDPGPAPVTGDDLKYAVALYDGEIAYTDHYIGLLLDELKKQNLYDDTLIVLLADHGEELNEHGEMMHGKHLYDDTLGVPLIVKLPGQRSGTLVRGTFPLIDLLPSIAKRIDCNTSAMDFQGTAVSLQGLRAIRDHDVYSATNYSGYRLESLRNATGKLIVDKNSNRVELYDVSRDPQEKRNMAGDMHGVSRNLESALHTIDIRIEKSLESAVFPSVTEQDMAANRQSLRALGYLQ
jgi:arylsulfatase A-like enzyme